MWHRNRRGPAAVAMTALVAGLMALGATAARGTGVRAQIVPPGPVYLPLAMLNQSPWLPPPVVVSATPSATAIGPTPSSATATSTATGIVWPTDTLTPFVTRTPTASPTPPPTPTSSLPPWQQYVQFHRWLARLPGISENTDWSRGDLLHSKYMVKNNVIGHSESPSRPFYTIEGNDAAANGNVFTSSATTGATQLYATYRDAIDSWMTGPFHMLGIIDPRLHTSGFGEYEEDIEGWHRYGATIDVLRGRGDVPAGVTFPVYYPHDGMTIPNLSYRGGESPDPLLAPKCRGYSVPTGPPFALQLGTGEITPHVTRTSVRKGTTELAHCWFDETTYPYSPGKEGLNMRDAIIIMPKDPLTDGQQYTVTIETGGEVYTWSFTADVGQRPLSLSPIGSMQLIPPPLASR